MLWPCRLPDPKACSRTTSEREGVSSLSARALERKIPTLVQTLIQSGKVMIPAYALFVALSYLMQDG